jgi:hypothetical protein
MFKVYFSNPDIEENRYYHFYFYTIKETPSKKHGMCYTIVKRVLPSSFSIFTETLVINEDRYQEIFLKLKMDWDIDLYLHEKGEEIWIALDIIPSELDLKYDTIDASNDDGLVKAEIKVSNLVWYHIVRN